MSPLAGLDVSNMFRNRATFPAAIVLGNILILALFFRQTPTWRPLASFRSAVPTNPLDERLGLGPGPSREPFPLGERFGLPYPALFPKPLGKDLLILEVDNRPWDNEGELFYEGPLEWDSINFLAAGRLAHYFYAISHGYDYKLARVPNLPGEHEGGWSKVPEMAKALKDHRFVLFLDGDLVFLRPEIPFEYLMNHWNVDKNISVALDTDWDPLNYELQPGQPFKNITNTGFVILQNNPTTHEMMEKWQGCTDEVHYKGCARWKTEWAHEQSSFSQYVQYEYEDVIRYLNGEANGYPELKTAINPPFGPHGKWLQHPWLDKDNLVDRIGPIMLQNVFNRLHNQFLEDTESIIIDHSDTDPFTFNHGEH